MTTVITLSLPDNNSQDYFAKDDDKNELKDVPPITISNKHIDNLHKQYLHPLSIQQAHSEPTLLSPHSILNKTGHSAPNVTNKHVSIHQNSDERRPSLVKFTQQDNSSSSAFFDAVNCIKDEEEQVYERKKSTSSNSYKSRPSLLSRLSSAYTNKTAAISLYQVDPFDQQYVEQGIVLCANVSANQKRRNEHQKYNHQQEIQKKPLKWKKYHAIITQSGYLELYRICHCIQRSNLNQLSHSRCFHSYLPTYSKPRFVIDLHPSIDNMMFQKKAALFRNRRRTAQKNNKALHDDTYFLSLMSPVDFSWSLTSVSNIFYFQTDTVVSSQQWYQSLYACLPSQSKKPLPKIVDLHIPELSICVRLPLDELKQAGCDEENIDLKRVRDSALVLLHRHGHRPPDWNRRTVGLCWKYKDQSDWAVPPSPFTAKEDDTSTAFLIEARLVEKTHELVLRHEGKTRLVELSKDEKIVVEEEEEKESKVIAEGYLDDVTCKKPKTVYAKTVDHYLFLYERDVYMKKTQDIEPTAPPSCFKLLFSKKAYRTNPLIKDASNLFDTHQDHGSSTLKGVVDLLKIKDISCNEQLETLHLDKLFSFHTVNQPLDYWNDRLKAVVRVFSNDSSAAEGNQIKKSGFIYVKSSMRRYSTFQKRTCILTKSGLFCALKMDHRIDFYIDLNNKSDSNYVYSGQECCTYIKGLPLELPSRLFDSGVVEKNDRPNQCCFVIHSSRNKEYVFLTRTQDQKESWVQSLLMNR